MTDKSKLDVLQKEKLMKLQVKQINANAFRANDLSQFVENAKKDVGKYEDEFGDIYTGLTEAQKAEKNAEIQMDPHQRLMMQSRKAYYRELKKVIEAADVVIEVLDARDPEGCRSEEIEQEALKGNKKVVLILNKIDLVPSQNARMWQKHLRQEFPTLLFKANQQKQNNLGCGTSLFKNSMIENSELVDKLTSASTAVGTENLMNLLKNYARIKGQAKTKQTIYVGIVGFPNVGKSSIINSLKRARATQTGNTPGVTKQMQEVQLDKNIILLDSPGVVLSTKEQSDSLILRSAIKIEEIDDPMRPVEAIMNRISHTEIMELYGIKDYTTIEELLASIAIKKGFLKKTGVPNFDNAARKVIRDYMDGKMNYFTPAPHTEGLEGEEMLDEEILNLARMGAAEDDNQMES